MRKQNFVFSIDALTPATLPMARLAEYLSDLAALVGAKAKVHFDEVAEGSAQLKWWAEVGAEEGIRSRLAQADSLDAPKDIARPFAEIKKKLVQDGANADLTEEGRGKLLYFPGRSAITEEQAPAFWQREEIVGRLVRIGGADGSIHAHIQTDAGVLSRFQMNEDVAKRLVHHFLGEPIRLIGRAKWLRSLDGKWSLQLFQVEAFEPLTRTSLLEDLAQLRALNPGGWLDRSDAANELQAIRYGDET